jgi:hypothetical protein
LEEGRLEVISEGRRRQQLRVNKTWDDSNF